MNKLETLKQVCAGYNVALAYLFGSQAEAGMAVLEGKRLINDDPLTDIDLGIVFAPGLPEASSIPDLYAGIYNELADLFLPLPLDLVFIQENHAVFQAEVVCGICVYCSDVSFRELFEEDVLRRAADFRPFLEKYLDEFLEEVTSKGDSRQ
ncbi:MAG: nucleotidyltransferase domain-containing protein [Bacillota bacterium]